MPESLVTIVREDIVGSSIPGVPNYAINPVPLDDGAIYPADDGTPYYRAGLRVADRRPGRWPARTCGSTGTTRV